MIDIPFEVWCANVCHTLSHLRRIDARSNAQNAATARTPTSRESDENAVDYLRRLVGADRVEFTYLAEQGTDSGARWFASMIAEGCYDEP